MKVLTEVKDLEIGKWYAVGMYNDNGVVDWSSAPLMKYEGESCFSNESNEEVTQVWDPVCQCNFSPSAADEFMLQS